MFASLANPGLGVGLSVIALVIVLLGLRTLVFRSTTAPSKTPREWENPVTALYGRGLTSAVLLIVSVEIVPSISPLFEPAILLIVGTNIAMTVWLFVRPVRIDLGERSRALPWAQATPQIISFAEAEPREPEPTGPAPTEDPNPVLPREPPPLPRPRDRPPKT